MSTCSCSADVDALYERHWLGANFLAFFIKNIGVESKCELYEANSVTAYLYFNVAFV